MGRVHGAVYNSFHNISPAVDITFTQQNAPERIY